MYPLRGCLSTVGSLSDTQVMKVRFFPSVSYLRSLMDRQRSSKPLYAGSIPVGDVVTTYSSGLRGQAATLSVVGSNPTVVFICSCSSIEENGGLLNRRCGFESRHEHFIRVVQWIEHQIPILEIAGLSPATDILSS